MNKTGIPVLLVLWIVLHRPPAASASLVYRFVDYPQFQDGGTLSGFIEVAESAPDDGLLQMGEVISWSWTATHPTRGTVGLNSADGGIETLVINPEGAMRISQREIVFLAVEEVSALHLQANAPDDSRALTYKRNFATDEYSVRQLSGEPIWSTFGPPLSLGDPWAIATAAPVAVPEPDPWLLAGTVSAFLILVLRRRRRGPGATRAVSVRDEFAAGIIRSCAGFQSDS